ncbi:MAG TPA: hypothetical protein VFM88_05980, partial [Vicinamibacteria bacterium]|nr:hypothetical protein [Vicinamibacteria bacterium]
ARKAGAEAYAPDLWEQASGALQSARQKVEQKDYRGALSSAIDAADKARAAAAAVPSAKVLLKGAAEVAQAEAQAALDEVAAIRDEARKARVPEAAFEALASPVGEVETGLKAVTDLLAQEDLIAAQKAGAELKAKAASLRSDFRAALDKWFEEHPKGRRPARKS